MPGSPDPQNEAILSEAIERTEGIQPWRRVFHATNGTLVVLAISVLGLKVATAILILGIVLMLAVVLDVVRLFDPKLNVLFFRTFSSIASPREARKIASSTWYALSALVALSFFPEPYALAGILVLALADPTASVVGQRWGRTRFLAGSVRGTAAFVVVAFFALLPFVPWWSALAAAGGTAVVEAAPIDLDDNLIVPLTVAGILVLIGG